MNAKMIEAMVKFSEFIGAYAIECESSRGRDVLLTVADVNEMVFDDSGEPVEMVAYIRGLFEGLCQVEVLFCEGDCLELRFEEF